jgi:hypothetical protein
MGYEEKPVGAESFDCKVTEGNKLVCQLFKKVGGENIPSGRIHVTLDPIKKEKYVTEASLEGKDMDEAMKKLDKIVKWVNNGYQLVQ